MVVGAKPTKTVALAYSDEYTTLTWIMEGLLERAGFTIERALYPESTLARYICRKQARG
jgi:hypothetical protein